MMMYSRQLSDAYVVEVSSARFQGRLFCFISSSKSKGRPDVWAKP